MKKRFSFYVLVKDFNSGKIEKYDVMPTLYRRIYDDKGNISNDFYVYDKQYRKTAISSKELLTDFVKDEFRYHFWAKCEYEFIAIDWPYSDTIDKSRPVKIDVYNQLEPNINIIVDLLWEEIKDFEYEI